PLQIADDDHLTLERLERLQHGRELEVRTRSRRSPRRHVRAVRDVDEAKARRTLCRGLRERRCCRHHRIEQWECETGTHSPKKRATWQRDLGDEHMSSGPAEAGHYALPLTTNHQPLTTNQSSPAS